MSTRANEGLGALTEKEKQTLRLIVRGHDAKSIACSLDLSVHTINERLRDARRKMAVSSSRAAARLLFDAEAGAAGSATHNFLGDISIGEDPARPLPDERAAPIGGAWRAFRHPWIIAGVLVMMFAFSLLALAALPQAGSVSPPATAGFSVPRNTEVADSARRWLVLLDQARWDESYQATGASFRKLNTLQVWAATSEQARAPLGAMMSRTLVSQENLPAPPGGYQVVKFRTRFANKADAVETITLANEDGSWRVVGIAIG